MEKVGNSQATAMALWSLGALWPSLYGAITEAMRSPLERALYASWCGAAPHGATEFLGHCAACWAGAGAFMLAGALALRFSRQRSPRAVI
jgi:hypothetical protein